MVRSGTCSIRRQQTRCHRQLSWVSTVSRGTNTPKISSEGTHKRPEPQEPIMYKALWTHYWQSQGPVATLVDPGPGPREGTPLKVGISFSCHCYGTCSNKGDLAGGISGKVSRRCTLPKTSSTHSVSPGYRSSPGPETGRKRSSPNHL